KAAGEQALALAMKACVEQPHEGDVVVNRRNAQHGGREGQTDRGPPHPRLPPPQREANFQANRFFHGDHTADEGGEEFIGCSLWALCTRSQCSQGLESALSSIGIARQAIWTRRHVGAARKPPLPRS